MGKINPKKKPATQADVNRAKREGCHYGTICTAALFLNVLLDKYNGYDYIAEVWKNVEKLAEEVAEGRIKLKDITGMLWEEYGIELEKTRNQK